MYEVKKILTESPEFEQIEKELFFRGEETADLIETFCHSKGVSIYAAMEGEFVTGFCVTSPSTSDVMHLLFIGVHRDYRKTGVAHALLDASIADQKPKAVVAEVPHYTLPFFTNYGFYAVEFGEDLYGKNVFYATYRVR
ncbi:MAG: GNAT family N-acetyltransferase [Oscillospiraceae bacterium]|nr:GNAT family N-acetyltransferase [Oscillospiraceae bacterium]MBR3610480.1 GNAT family N-acetyltransferase [Oscillospiraceae bacterium]